VHCSPLYSIADQDADVFILYHYNGFSGLSTASSGIAYRKLTRLTLFRRSQESSVGQSIAFSGGGGSAFTGSAVSPIEEVNTLRSMLPGCCCVFDWIGGIYIQYTYAIICMPLECMYVTQSQELILLSSCTCCMLFMLLFVHYCGWFLYICAGVAHSLAWLSSGMAWQRT
jgi:hypothetical protein